MNQIFDDEPTPFDPAEFARSQKARADAQALADVRTLDAAEEVGFEFDWLVNAGPRRVLTVTTPDRRFAHFEGGSREDARAKAAAWVREQGAPHNCGCCDSGCDCACHVGHE